VRTGGRYGGARGGDPNRSWLLIKHRDEWSGDLDITEFAPRSVKSDGDFEDILGEETPAVWQSHRPATGGDAGAMFARIITRATGAKGAKEAKGAMTRNAKAAKDAQGKAASKKKR
jgi:hypothetical protein